ncbi:MAG: hypothetical protein R3Y36_04270 [Spirochaetales bacterium]
MKALYFLWLCTFCLLGSCSHSGDSFFDAPQSVQISLISSSPAPTHIVYIDENLNPKTMFILPGATTINVPLKQNRLTPILLYCDEADTQPHGCIYPIAVQTDQKSGFTAWILYKLLVSSNENNEDVYDFLARFNWSRFHSYIETYENPWILNQDLIFENIADATFNVYSIKKK